MKNLSKTYDPKEFEDRLYAMWEESGSFHSDVDPDRKPFTIVMPPPNITGKLHMGHALDQTLQDVLIRYKRMRGYNALWIPGSDHASIATEVKVANRLRDEEGLEKEDLGREAFLERVWDWKREFGGTITRQCASWETPVTGPGNGSPWMRAAPRPFVRFSSDCTTGV